MSPTEDVSFVEKNDQSLDELSVIQKEDGIFNKYEKICMRKPSFHQKSKEYFDVVYSTNKYIKQTKLLKNKYAKLAQIKTQIAEIQKKNDEYRKFISILTGEDIVETDYIIKAKDILNSSLDTKPTDAQNVENSYLSVREFNNKNDLATFSIYKMTFAELVDIFDHNVEKIKKLNQEVDIMDIEICKLEMNIETFKPYTTMIEEAKLTSNTNLYIAHKKMDDFTTIYVVYTTSYIILRGVMFLNNELDEYDEKLVIKKIVNELKSKTDGLCWWMYYTIQ
jgi:hypothetical protein